MDRVIAGELAAGGTRKSRLYTGRPWLFEVEDEDSQLADLIDVTETDGGLMQLHGSGMRTVEQLWDCYGRALAFPRKVENWPSFAEQMRDLSWYQAFSFLILIRGSGELLADDPGERETFRRISSMIGQAWENSLVRSYSFTTVLLECSIEPATDPRASR